MPSKIEWTEETWNPSVGCTPISSGCKHCYARTMALRLQSMGQMDYANGFDFTILPHRLDVPLKRTRPTLYFINSMSDLFHEDMPIHFIDEILNTIEMTPHHRYQILTKRSQKMLEYFTHRPIPHNTMLGVTAENIKEGLPRIDDVRRIAGAPIKFVSIEPLISCLPKRISRNSTLSTPKARHV